MKMAEVNQFIPRLCHVKKRPAYSGYGFCLQIDKQDGRQHFCEIKADSPAEEAGLSEGDILIEVNGANVEETPASVFQRIIDSGNEAHLLVVDAETDKFYKDQGLMVTSSMPGVKHMPCRTNISEINQSTPRLCHLKKRPDYSGYGFSLRLDEQDGRQYFSRVKIGSPAWAAGIIEGDILVEVNDVKVEGEAHGSVLQRIIDSGNEVYLLVVNTETDKFFEDQVVTGTVTMPEVKRIASGTNVFETNLYGPNGQQQTTSYNVGSDQGPSYQPQQLKPFHFGYDQPSNGRSVGGPYGSYPMIQQLRLTV